MSNFWSAWVIAIVVINILGCLALLYYTRTKKENADEGETTNHVYDGIEEYDNPLPRWWLWLFYITIVFSIIYLVLYPGLGKYKGALDWSQASQYQEEVQIANERFYPLYQKYAAMSIEQLQNEPEALKIGQSVFANVCYTCHGADARGSLGFPNLMDDDWIYGGSPEKIKETLVKGRNGVMPAWGEILSERQIDSVSSYLSSKNISGRVFVKELVDEGEAVYLQNCLVCHGADLKGNQALGATNLVDDVWLHGASPGLVKDVLYYGRNNKMPAHIDILGEEKTHIVAAYVYSLSNKKDNTDDSNDGAKE